MRKINSLIVSVLFVGVVAFMAAPAFADYLETGAWNNQLNNTTFGVSPTGFGIGSTPYGPEAIVVPYEGEYGFPGCEPVTVNDGINPPYLLTNPSYVCNTEDVAVDSSDLLIEDIFGYVQEGDSAKVAGNQGFTQSMDNFVASNVGGQTALTTGADAEHFLFSATLDQEIADLDLTGNGIYQRLHNHFSRLVDLTLATPYDEDGQDQTMIAYVSDHAIADPDGSNPDGRMISYVAQWWQKGTEQNCSTPEAAGLCNHDEFSAGHGTVTGSVYSPNLLGHDP